MSVQYQTFNESQIQIYVNKYQCSVSKTYHFEDKSIVNIHKDLLRISRTKQRAFIERTNRSAFLGE
jgi:hypothetical protein